MFVKWRNLPRPSHKLFDYCENQAGAECNRIIVGGHVAQCTYHASALWVTLLADLFSGAIQSDDYLTFKTLSGLEPKTCKTMSSTSNPCNQLRGLYYDLTTDRNAFCGNLWQGLLCTGTQVMDCLIPRWKADSITSAVPTVTENFLFCAFGNEVHVSYKCHLYILLIKPN